MFEVFSILAGFWGMISLPLRYALDSGRKRDSEISAKKYFTDSKHKHEEFKSKVSDPILEEELRKKILRLEEYPELLDKVKEAYKSMGRNDVPDMFWLCRYYDEEALIILMAYNGKLRQRDCLQDVGFAYDIKTKGATYGDELKENIENCIKLLFWVDSKLKEFGVRELIWIHPSIVYSNENPLAAYLFTPENYKAYRNTMLDAYLWSPLCTATVRGSSNQFPIMLR